MKQIWVIDDNADSRALAREILSSDYDLLEVDSGIGALQLLEHQCPDLILLDLSMPGVSGFDVLAAIRSRIDLCHIPVIAYTARASKPERAGILAFGFDHCVVKPVLDENDLIRPITQLLGQHAGV